MEIPALEIPKIMTVNGYKVAGLHAKTRTGSKRGMPDLSDCVCAIHCGRTYRYLYAMYAVMKDAYSSEEVTA